MDKFILFIQFAGVIGGGGLWLVFFVIVVKRWAQDQMDARRITYEVTFPDGLDIGTAALVFESLSGIFKHPGTPTNFMGETTIVVEILSTPAKMVYLLSF